MADHTVTMQYLYLFLVSLFLSEKPTILHLRFRGAKVLCMLVLTGLGMASYPINKGKLGCP